MEKYAKLMKGLEMCSGPECCKDGCPYYNMTTGGMTCRARLLLDANIAITNEQGRADAAEEEMGRLHADVDDLEAVTNTLRAERDGLRIESEKLKQDLTCVIQHRDELAADKNAIREENKCLIEARDALVRKASDLNSRNEELRKECDMVAARCQVLQNEINALLLKLGNQEDKTDRPSVSSDDLDNIACELQRYRTEAGYWHGKAAALEWFIREWFREGGFAP